MIVAIERSIPIVLLEIVAAGVRHAEVASKLGVAAQPQGGVCSAALSAVSIALGGHSRLCDLELRPATPTLARTTTNRSR